MAKGEEEWEGELDGDDFPVTYPSDEEVDSDDQSSEEESDGNSSNYETMSGSLLSVSEAKKITDPFDDNKWAKIMLKETRDEPPNPNSNYKPMKQEAPPNPELSIAATKTIPMNNQKMNYFCTGCNKIIKLAIGDKVQCRNRGSHMLYRLRDYRKMQTYQAKGIKVQSFRFRRNFKTGEKVVTCDGSYKKKENFSVSSSFARDENLDFIECSGIANYKPFNFNSNNSETEALNVALKASKIQKEAKGTGKLCSKIHIFSDSKLNVNAYNEGILHHPRHRGKVKLSLINQCRNTAGLKEWEKEMEKGEQNSQQVNSNFVVTHIPRELNQLAHLAAIRRTEGNYDVTDLSEKMKRVMYEERDLGLYRVRFPKKPKQKLLEEYQAEEQLKRIGLPQPQNPIRSIPSESDTRLIRYQKDKIDQGNYHKKENLDISEKEEKTEANVAIQKIQKKRSEE